MVGRAAAELWCPCWSSDLPRDSGQRSSTVEMEAIRLAQHVAFFHVHLRASASPWMMPRWTLLLLQLLLLSPAAFSPLT